MKDAKGRFGIQNDTVERSVKFCLVTDVLSLYQTYNTGIDQSQGGHCNVLTLHGFKNIKHPEFYYALKKA